MDQHRPRRNDRAVAPTVADLKESNIGRKGNFDLGRKPLNKIKVSFRPLGEAPLSRIRTRIERFDDARVRIHPDEDHATVDSCSLNVAVCVIGSPEPRSGLFDYAKSCAGLGRVKLS